MQALAVILWTTCGHIMLLLHTLRRSSAHNTEIQYMHIASGITQHNLCTYMYTYILVHSREEKRGEGSRGSMSPFALKMGSEGERNHNGVQQLCSLLEAVSTIDTAFTHNRSIHVLHHIDKQDWQHVTYTHVNQSVCPHLLNVTTNTLRLTHTW